jgi:hypothetical protein
VGEKIVSSRSIVGMLYLSEERGGLEDDELFGDRAHKGRDRWL